MDSRTICLVSLVGLPGSGKTTFAKEFTRFATNFDVVHVCYDELLPLEKQATLTQNKNVCEMSERNDWKDFRKEVFNCVKLNLVEEDCVAKSTSSFGFEILNNKFVNLKKTNPFLVVILDDNNYFQSMRYEWYQLARELNCGFCQFFFPTSEEKAIENNAKRKKNEQVPAEVIEKMHKKLEPPNLEKNQWERLSLAVTGEKDYAACQGLVLKAAECPVVPGEDSEELKQEKDNSRAENRANLVHTCDKILRKCVGSVLKDKRSDIASKNEMKKIAEELNQIKNNVLAEVRNGDHEFPENPELLEPILHCMVKKQSDISLQM